MAMRVRQDGTMVCAAYAPELPGDTYIDDTVHHYMITHGSIVALPMPQHEDDPRWWWRSQAPQECDFSTGVNYEG